MNGERDTRPGSRAILYGILCVVLVIVVLQLWLLSATMNAYLGGDTGVILPAAVVSAVCLALNAGLLRHLRRFGATRRGKARRGPEVEV